MSSALGWLHQSHLNPLDARFLASERAVDLSDALDVGRALLFNSSGVPEIRLSTLPTTKSIGSRAFFLSSGIFSLSCVEVVPHHIPPNTSHRSSHSSHSSICRSNSLQSFSRPSCLDPEEYMRRTQTESCFCLELLLQSHHGEPS